MTLATLVPLQVTILGLVAVGATLVALCRNPLRQIVLSGVYGLLLVILFVVLQAPDVALSMLVVDDRRLSADRAGGDRATPTRARRRTSSEHSRRIRGASRGTGARRARRRALLGLLRGPARSATSTASTGSC